MLQILTKNDNLNGSTYNRYSLVAQNVSRVLFDVDDASEHILEDGIYITVQIGQKTVVPRIPLQYLAELNKLEAGTGMVSEYTEAIFSIDLGNYPLSDGEELYVSLDHADPGGNVYVTIGAEVNTLETPECKVYEYFTDTAFQTKLANKISVHGSNLDENTNDVTVGYGDNKFNVPIMLACIQSNADSVGDAKISSTGFILDEEIPKDVNINIPSGSNVSFISQKLEAPSIKMKVQAGMFIRKAMQMKPSELMNLRKMG